jgi:hypothetical protein
MLGQCRLALVIKSCNCDGYLTHSRTSCNACMVASWTDENFVEDVVDEVMAPKIRRGLSCITGPTSNPCSSRTGPAADNIALMAKAKDRQPTAVAGRRGIKVSIVIDTNASGSWVVSKSSLL